MLAQFSAAQEGIYTIHSNNMAVRKPRNANDEDIVEGMEIIDRPLNQPTCVSYLIQRIRLAEVCRGILERFPLGAPPSDHVAYGLIMEADAKMNQLLHEIPDFFNIDKVKAASSVNHSLASSDSLFPAITIQRYTLNLILHRQLCRMHLPFLAQGTVDPAYVYSRDVCLKSARFVISLDHQMQRENLPFFTSRLRLTMVLRSVFLASIALVLNVCLKGESGENAEGGEEVADAWRILQDAQSQSSSASTLLNLSVQVLKKYKVNHIALEALQQQRQEIQSPQATIFPMTPESVHTDQRIGKVPQSFATETETAFLEQQWHVLEGKMDLNTIDWDKLFWGIDAPFI